jgi:hypothetical protein
MVEIVEFWIEDADEMLLDIVAIPVKVRLAWIVETVELIPVYLIW